MSVNKELLIDRDNTKVKNVDCFLGSFILVFISLILDVSLIRGYLGSYSSVYPCTVLTSLAGCVEVLSFVPMNIGI